MNMFYRWLNMSRSPFVSKLVSKNVLKLFWARIFPDFFYYTLYHTTLSSTTPLLVLTSYTEWYITWFDSQWPFLKRQGDYPPLWSHVWSYSRCRNYFSGTGAKDHLYIGFLPLKIWDPIITWRVWKLSFSFIFWCLFQLTPYRKKLHAVSKF